MPRQARLQSPTGYYHIMMRGHNRESIFINKGDKQYFKDLLKEQIDEGLIDLSAYCIMDNHVHMVIKAELDNMAKAIKKISIKYAMNFNKVKNRLGYVFQGRYKSEAVADDKYLLQVIRYVHNNPVKAKMVGEPNAFKWSSYNEYIKSNMSSVVGISQRDYILEINNGVKNFIEFHKTEDDKEYLEISEDRDLYRLDKAQSIISTYFKEKGIFETKELNRNPVQMEELIISLLDNTELSQRKIATLLGIGHHTVHLINKERS